MRVHAHVLDFCVGVAAQVLRDEFREKRKRICGRRAQAQRGAHDAGFFAALGEKPLKALVDVFATLVEHASCLGGRHALCGAHKQGKSQLTLESADMLRHRLRRHEMLCGGFGEAPQVDDVDEKLALAVFHDSPSDLRETDGYFRLCDVPVRATPSSPQLIRVSIYSFNPHQTTRTSQRPPAGLDCSQRMHMACKSRRGISGERLRD